MLIFLTILATALSAVGLITQASAAKKSAGYNAQVAIMQAKAARERAVLDESRQRKKAGRLKGTAQARAAASGLTIESFSPVFEESAREAELDALIIRHEGEMTAWGKKAEAGLSRMRGKSAQTAGILSVGSTLLGGGIDVYGIKTSKKVKK